MKTSEEIVKDLSEKIDILSRGFDHDFVELVDCGIDSTLVQESMHDDLLHQIEKAVIKFEITNPNLYILGLERVRDEQGRPEVVLDWVDSKDEE